MKTYGRIEVYFKSLLIWATNKRVTGKLLFPGNSCQYPLNGRLDKPHSQSGRFGSRKGYPALARNLLCISFMYSIHSE
jgi:hypothetical protein